MRISFRVGYTPAMEVIALQSGSEGNCTYVRSGRVQLLFDAGISGRQAEQRLAAHGRDIRQIDALVVSHEHRDHACGIGVFHRRFGLPVYATRPTLAAIQSRTPLGSMQEIRHFASQSTIDFGDVRVETIRTPHDACDGVAFVVDDGEVRLGILTDLGHSFEALHDVVHSCDAVVLESNYDEQLLSRGAYPESLKQRIRGPRGHLSNKDAAKLVFMAAGPRLQWVCLAHLSGDNNRPELALAAQHQTLGRQLPVFVAPRDRDSGLLSVN